MDWFRGNKKDFLFKEQEIGGDLCVLITPKSNISWTDENKIYRSSIWRVSDGTPVSLGFKKFVNFGEQPTFEPVSEIFDKDFILTEKLDGSCLIISKYKGQIIIRTRGTFDARILKNGSELEPLIQKYNILRYFNSYETANFSLVFEWVSPKHQIVLRYDEPDLYFIGMVNHNDYSYVSQEILNSKAHTVKWKRPRQYQFANLNSYIEIADTIKGWTAREGVVLYFNNGQLLKKMKSAWYNNLHQLKFNISTLNKIVECMYSNGFLVVSEDFNKEKTAKDFYKFIEKQFDFEVAEYIKTSVNTFLNQFERYVIKPYKECLKRLREVENYDNAKEIANLFSQFPSLNQKMTWMIYRDVPFNDKVILNLIKSNQVVE